MVVVVVWGGKLFCLLCHHLVEEFNAVCIEKFVPEVVRCDVRDQKEQKPNLDP